MDNLLRPIDTSGDKSNLEDKELDRLLEEELKQEAMDLDSDEMEDIFGDEEVAEENTFKGFEDIWYTNFTKMTIEKIL